ncbi:MAG: excinuclease ABC subunit UvrA [bacterium]
MNATSSLIKTHKVSPISQSPSEEKLPPSEGYIAIRGAREHNLKNIDLDIPRNRLVVITGLSGSGKSSLAFDTLYAEGQRRYVESLSAYARQFLGLMEKPDVDRIDGLSPAISIEQKAAGRNPRSTVGTVTEIYDYLRLLYARIGVPHCPSCGKVVERQTAQEIIDRLHALPPGTKLTILAPLVRGRKGEYQDLFRLLRQDGFTRVIVDGTLLSLEEEFKLDKNRKHTIRLVVDRLIVKPEGRERLADSVELALRQSGGIVEVMDEQGKIETFSEHFACVECGISFEELSPRLFSFNSPYGACPACTGLGFKMEVNPRLVVPDPSLSILDGAIATFNNSRESWMMRMLEQVASHSGFSLRTPFEKLHPQHQELILYGSKGEKIRFRYLSEDGRSLWEHESEWEGIIPNLQRRYHQTDSQMIREWIESFMGDIPCLECHGERLKPEARSVKVKGVTLPHLVERSIGEVLHFFRNLSLTPREITIARQVVKELIARLEFLTNVGLSYLTLSRPTGTLSGGEAQRIRLATQIGSGLVGVMYILDEPSIGLHQRDNIRLIKTLKHLRDLGNTVIVVEHDRETIESADWVVDLGPGAGVKGGYVVAEGPPQVIKEHPQSLTGKFLSEREKIDVPLQRRKPKKDHWLILHQARGNNLKNIDVRFPLGLFIAVTGVSGSGKSSLVVETVYPLLARQIYGSRVVPLPNGGMKGTEKIDKVINIDQSPIGRTPRSNPATYTGLFDPIRHLFASLPEARLRGYKPGRFSFNVRGGRCEQCQGGGIIKIEMHFLPDVYVTCELCKGRRYNQETLEVKFKGRTISDVLSMSVMEAQEFFRDIPPIRRKLDTLADVGLGYIALGQPATTLSGGEAQRVKLATELSKVATGRTFYILDEPTTGLHFADVRMLLHVLQTLVDRGNTVVVIEHNLEVIKCADWIIDLGPEGGDEGGYIVAEGPPEEVARVKRSWTGKFLKDILPTQAA